MLFFAGIGVGGVAFAAPDSVEVDGVVRALSSRDPIGCAQVESLTATPTDTLRAVVDTVSMPPWVPMRAAQCLVEGHGVEVRADLLKWVVDPKTLGLGWLVLEELDRLPVDLAVEVAGVALTKGPDRASAAEKIQRASAPQVRALVTK